uniref:Ribosome biogenesis protein NOP53 n=1 Tax=Angiostrongylus cantonensis TaxID=6313 RepID=A0A0K0DBH1_ANGCA
MAENYRQLSKNRLLPEGFEDGGHPTYRCSRCLWVIPLSRCTSCSDDNASGEIADRPSHEVYTIDCTLSHHLSRYTKRQRAALDKISRSISEHRQLPLPPPRFPSKKQPKLKQTVKRVEHVPFKQKVNYDLWEKDFVPKVNLNNEEAKEHLLRYTKKKLPNMPSTVRFKPSLLDAVTLPDAGASYNPKADDYQKYISKIAVDETNLIKEEERIEKGIRPQLESVITYAEKSFEEVEGLVIDPRYDIDDVDMGEKIVISDLMRKTRKQRQNAAKEKKFLREQKRRKEIEKKQHDVYKAKKINKELSRREVLIEEERLKRRKEKFLKKMTSRQRLGRGKFKDEEEPFLLQEELTDCLRLLKPQGHVLNDRMTSLQKRNMLPIGGKREQNKLKLKLKSKLVEKRLAAEVTKGSRVV